MLVTTYRFAYIDGTATLCRACAESSATPLGAVQHGAHDGACEGCDPLLWQAAEALRCGVGR